MDLNLFSAQFEGQIAPSVFPVSFPKMSSLRQRYVRPGSAWSLPKRISVPALRDDTPSPNSARAIRLGLCAEIPLGQQ